ncbi:hypothetical protein B0H10DRAFT_2209927 [Mycena sp. CBHHK59/15]|nr:hypothetical protein B0H10DRAFT_2209927 [Mycena sp. CBHHK59/15]
MAPCVPPFYPSSGHANRPVHDNNVQCLYYAVFVGRLRGVYTNSWLAREQTDGYTNSRQKSFKSWRDVEAWWSSQCLVTHRVNCPPFEALNFSLDPSPTTHPSSSPCSYPHAAEDDEDEEEEDTTPGAAVPPATSSSSSYQPAYIGSGAPPSYRSTLPADTVIPPAIPPAPSPFTSSSHAAPAAVKKEEEGEPNLARLSLGVTPQTRVLLTPTGHARVAALAQSSGRPVPPHMASVVATPGGPPRPPPRPSHPPHVAQYGILGVGVFYNSHAEARAAAARLEMPDAKIMVSDNPEKLEAWMMGKPFVGEDS